MYDIKIILKNNNGFTWYNSDGIYLKGYFLTSTGFLTGQNAIRYLAQKINDFSSLKKSLCELNGVFTFILQKEGQVLLCSDRMRSFPLFYSVNNNELMITDDSGNFNKKSDDLDEESVKIFLHTGYSTGSKTLLKDVFQIQAGEYVLNSDKGFNRYFYHTYGTQELSNNETDLEAELEFILNKIGDDLAVSLEGKTPVIPLSSGFDSRLIACMLKKRGFNNVITFTYGRKDNPELELSERVAGILNYNWNYIEYNKDIVRGYMNSEQFNDYYPKASNHTSMFYLQEYFAMEKLKEILPGNAVLIPGHSGDFFAGSHLNRQIINSTSKDNIIKEIIAKHFSNKKIEKPDYKLIYNSVEDSLSTKSTHNFLDFENWDLKERQAKFIINSNRIYDFFGFEYRLPLMDSRLMDFFAKVSPELKFGKKLYDKVLKDKIFKNLDLNFENETNPTHSDLEIQNAKNILKKFLPKKIINFYKERFKNNSDIYYNFGVTEQMIEDLKNSREKIDESGENRNSIIIQWYISKIKNVNKNKRHI